MSSKNKELGDFAAKALTVYEAVLKATNGELSVDQMRCFWQVAQTEYSGGAISLSELADALGMVQSSCSRNVAALCGIERPRKPGAGLLEQYLDYADRRSRFLRLTSKGHRLVAKVKETCG